MPKWLIIFIVLIAAGAAWFWFNNNQKTKYAEVCFYARCFQVEIARTIAQKEKGLMFRQSLADNGGMIFVYSAEDWRPMWMKNTLIPLDFIWLNKNKEVVYLAKNVSAQANGQYANLNSDQKAQYVMEINAGWIDFIGLKIGDKAEFEL